MSKYSGPRLPRDWTDTPLAHAVPVYISPSRTPEERAAIKAAVGSADEFTGYYDAQGNWVTRAEAYARLGIKDPLEDCE